MLKKNQTIVIIFLWKEGIYMAEIQNKEIPMRCWRCGRILYEDLRNGLPKMSSLKATLKAAYISSIKNKIYSNDKGNSFS